MREYSVPRPPKAPESEEFIDFGWDVYDDEDEDDDNAHIEVVSRMIPGNPDTERPTVLITAEWNEQSSGIWDKVVIKSKIMADEMVSRGQLSTTFEIEMIATQIAWPMYMGVIRNQPYLASQWPVLAQGITRYCSRTLARSTS